MFIMKNDAIYAKMNFHLFYMENKFEKYSLEVLMQMFFIIRI